MVFCSLIASSAIRAFISALKLRRCLDFISAPFPRQRFYTLLTGPNFGEHLKPALSSDEFGKFKKGRSHNHGLVLRLFVSVALSEPLKHLRKCYVNVSRTWMSQITCQWFWAFESVMATSAWR